MPGFWPRQSTLFGILAGLAYGMVLRFGFELRGVSETLDIISFAFLFGAPFVVGAISVYVASRNSPLTLWTQLAVSTSSMFFFLLCMMLFLLEGAICIVMASPIFFGASIVGGISMGLALKVAPVNKITVNGLLLLPLALGTFESSLDTKAVEATVESAAVVDAQPEIVFDQLINVSNIRKDEPGFSYMRLIGLPRPLEASMSGKGVGAVRTSEKGIRFEERTSRWETPYHLHYEFEFSPGSIPPGALDEHVRIGGRYFEVVRGGYDVVAGRDGRSKLVLKTTYRNKSRLNTYGNLWADFALDDFHRSVLQLMKRRAEQQVR